MNVISIKDLNKQFVSTRALDNVNLEVEEGTICGLLGPNGAGKTTLLRILNNILTADSGEVLIKGQPASFKTSRYLGYMPEERGLYDNMRVEDQILYFGQLKGGDKARLRLVMNEYLELFNLGNDKRRKIKELSKGNQQKVQIISTIVHEPDVVVLDEPFSGFDPINGAILQELIGRLHKRGATIILSSHNMPAIEEMCEEIALIDHGHLLLNGKIDDIKEQNKEGHLILTLREPLHIPLMMDSRTIESVKETATPHHRKGYSYEMVRKGDATNADILNAAAIQGDVVHFEEKLPSLQELFIQYTTGRVN